LTLRSQLAGALLTAVLAAGVCTLPARADEHAPQPPKNAREATLAEYRQHLVELNEVVGTCARARDNKSCDPELAGQDDRVPLFNTQERRLVRYNWLRVLLWSARTKDVIPKTAQDHNGNKAQTKTDNTPEDKARSEAGGGAKEAPAEEYTRPLKPTTGELLQAAQLRLARDLTQADSAAAGEPAAAPDYSQERNTMKQVLAGRDFRNLEPPTKRDSLLEKLDEWLNRLFKTIGKLHANVDWLGPVIVWGFILATCVGLTWGLLQLERRWRIRLVPESDGPAAGAASARDWQLWIDDARRAAVAGQWREAIHFVYWAAISRLESKRLWPADRARTPREYLALVTTNDPRRAGLATLTGSFERTWYGGRKAGESEYMQAEKLAEGLISGSGAAEGGAR
jgi:hypothetical protein